MNETVYRITELAVRLAVLVIVSVLIPQMKKVIRNQQVDAVVKKAVYAAQQLLWDSDGTKRKAFAQKMAQELLGKIGIKIDAGQLSALIEAAVQEMHIAKGDYRENKQEQQEEKARIL